MLVVEQPNIITTFSKNKTVFLYNKIAYREDVFNLKRSGYLYEK